MGREGSDGSDGRYRMTIESHYQQMASSREAFLSTSRLQLGHAALALLLAVTTYALPPLLLPPSPIHPRPSYEWLLVVGLPLLHAGLALYGRRALRANAEQKIRQYVGMTLAVAVGCLLSGLHAAFFSSSAEEGDRTGVMLHRYAPVGLAVLGTASALTSVLHARHFLQALSATSASRSRSAAKKAS